MRRIDQGAGGRFGVRGCSRNSFAAVVRYFVFKSMAYTTFKGVAWMIVRGYRAPVKSRIRPYFMA
jgi:hypothetical protein